MNAEFQNRRNCMMFLAMLPVSVGLTLAADDDDKNREKPKTIRIGTADLVGILSYGSVGLGGASTGVRITVDRRSFHVRVDDKRLLSTLKKYDGKRVWIEGTLAYEKWHSEQKVPDSKKYELVVKADHARNPRTNESEDICNVSVEGLINRTSIQFADGEALEWEIEGEDGDLQDELDRLREVMRKLEGVLTYDRSKSSWKLTVSRVVRSKRRE